MRIAMVGCMVMNREINYIVARSPNIVRVWWMRQGLHETPQVLRAKLQETIDAIEEENADYLMSCTNDWMSNYRYCGYITCPLGGDEPYRAYARQAAADFGWTYREIEGRLSYFEALLNGPWDDGRFLVCPPGHQIRPDYSNRKLRSEPC